MATAKKKAPAKKKVAAKKKAPAKKAAAPKKAAAKKSPARKAAVKSPEKGNFLSNAFKEAWDQLDAWVDTAKLKAQELAAEEKLMQKKAELALKAEVDNAKHLAAQAEKWMRARVKSDTRKINAFERKLMKQLRDAEKKLKAQAKAAERKANRKGKALKKNLQDIAKKVAPKSKAAAPRKKAVAKKKAAAK
jgi:colicin import membrane protein